LYYHKIKKISATLFFFFLAGLCEIGGGYLVWLWIRKNKGLLLGLIGGVILFLYGIIPTLQPANFGRVYAAYGGSLFSHPFYGVGLLTKRDRTDMR
jgi:drug/metabolite transporter superfamily protein YnfA